MPANSKVTEFLTGKIYWAKILGEPRLSYGGDGKEWTLEFEPDEEGLKVFKKHKLTDRIKRDKEGRKPYIKLKKKAVGDAKPIRVYDADNIAWDSSKLIGNESIADVKISIVDYGIGKKSGVYVDAVRIKELVPYVSSEFGRMDGPQGAPAKRAKADTFSKDFGLDDLDDDID